MGCFTYADDIVLLAPTKYALSEMYTVACKFSSEYNMGFNAKKSKLMLFDTYETSSMTINGEELMCTNQEVHLENVNGTCKNATKNVINNATNDFIKRVNVINAQFRSVLSSTKSKLFKTFCMPKYGCELWDFSFFFVACRKSIRLLWYLPYRTHCNLLPIICDDLSVEYQLLARIQTPPQKACCVVIATREAIHMREHIMDYNPFTLNNLKLLIHQVATYN